MPLTSSLFFFCLQGILTIGHCWRRAEETKAKHAEEIKAVEARHVEEIKAAEARIASLSEELRKFQESVAKVTAIKEKFKEAMKINFKEATKLQDDLVISRKEIAELEGRVKLLEETNSCHLEKFKGATFNCFYLFWKSNPEANFNYLPE